MQKKGKFVIFTDGSCYGNPGKGGTGAVVLQNGIAIERISQGYISTTNNRMELRAAIAALEKYNSADEIEIWSDSRYVVNGAEDWMKGWKENGWKRKEGNRNKEVSNLDLWMKVDELNNERVHWNWVKGHASDEWNEMADTIAQTAALRGPHIPDTR